MDAREKKFDQVEERDREILEDEDENREFMPKPGTWRAKSRDILTALYSLGGLGCFVVLTVNFLVSRRISVLVAFLGLPLMWLAIELARQIATHFACKFYNLPRRRDGRDLLEYLHWGRPEIPPTISFVKQGEVHHGDVILKHYGGPGGIFVTSDSAVILEKAGRLTRLVRGPQLVELDHFEKVWDVLELYPHRWVFEVGAITKDGIPITYATDVRFQIDLTGTPEEQEAAILRAAACKWIRDSWRTEPDRLMTWPKRVIISATEGNMRTILARYDLDQLLEEHYRVHLRSELTEVLSKAVAGMGVRLLGVELGDIKLGDKILQQWTASWRAAKKREMNVRIAEAAAERAKALEQAKAEIRTDILRKTVAKLQDVLGIDDSGSNGAADGTELKMPRVSPEAKRLSSQLVLLSCIEVIKQIEFNPNVFLPDDIVSVLDSVRGQMRCKNDNT